MSYLFNETSVPFTGDASTSTVLASGSNTARSLATRFTDTINVLDYLTAGQPDGTTDNTTQLQAAINAAAGKAKVLFPKTTSNYVVTIQASPAYRTQNLAGLVIPSNSHLIIEGTIFLKAAASGGIYCSTLYCNQASNVFIEGVGIIDGNKANQTVYQAGVLFDTCSNVYVTGITVQNANGSGLVGYGCTNMVWNGCKMLSCVNSHGFVGSPGVFPSAYSSNCWATNCIISSDTDFGFTFYDGCKNSGIIGCYATSNTGGPGIGVLTDGGYNLMSSNILIANNICSGNQYGIVSQVTGSAIGHGTHSGVTITGNQVTTSTNYGILLQYTDHVTVNGNSVLNNTSAGIVFDQSTDTFTCSNNLISGNAHGIEFKNSAGNGSVQNNVITASNDGGGNGTGILFIDSTSNNLLISGNHIYDEQGTPTQTWGIRSQASSPSSYSIGTGIVIIDNEIANATNAAYRITVSSDTIYRSFTGTNTISFNTPVSISSGTIDNAAIGSTTPSTASVTTLKLTKIDTTSVAGSSNIQTEYGSTTAATTPYFDWHSSGNAIDYDFRMMASGGTTSVGAGTLTLTGGTLSLSCALQTTQAVIKKVNYVTSGTTYTCTASDHNVIFVKTVGSATAVTLVASPNTGREIVIKDGRGDAATNPITISPAAGTIDGASTFVIRTNYGAVSLIYNGSEWNAM